MLAHVTDDIISHLDPCGRLHHYHQVTKSLSSLYPCLFRMPLQLLPLSPSVFSHSVDIGLTHVTYFDQRSFVGYDENRGLTFACLGWWDFLSYVSLIVV